MAVALPMQEGAEGADVRGLQLRLMALGFNIGPSGADGIFGPETRAAVAAFQRSVNERRLQSYVRDDGVVDRRTWDELLVPSVPALPGAPPPTPSSGEAKPPWWQSPGILIAGVGVLAAVAAVVVALLPKRESAVGDFVDATNDVGHGPDGRCELPGKAAFTRGTTIDMKPLRKTTRPLKAS